MDLSDIQIERLRFAVRLLDKYTAYDGTEAMEDLDLLLRLAALRSQEAGQ